MSDEQSLNLGQRLKDIRKALNMSQKDFAASVSIYNSYLSNLENGKSLPGFDLCVKLATIHLVRLDFLFFGTGDMFTNLSHQGVMDAGEESKAFVEEIETVDDLLWVLNHSSIFRNTIMGMAGKFFFDNRDMIKGNIIKFKNKNGDKNESKNNH